MKIPECKTLRLVLGDQLNEGHSWFRQVDDGVLYVLAELHQEATYAPHHIQKVAGFFLAMTSFASRIEAAGHQVLHLTLDETAAYADLPALLRALIRSSGACRFEYQNPDEYRLFRQLESFCESLEIESCRHGSEHFLLCRDELPEWFPKGKKQVMEHFYRRMRRRLGVLVTESGQPEGYRWNYDIENRQRLPHGIPLPGFRGFANDASAVLERIARHRIPVIGSMDGESLSWPVDRDQSLSLLEDFIAHRLGGFGAYQDAMTDRDPTLFHSRLSFSLNTKMLSPLEVIRSVLRAWEERRDDVELASVEGFIRQVMGWREFMRGMYWTHMPEYKALNHFKHDRPLPRFFWDGKTHMACMAQAIGQSLDHAYAHHIQRLMVTGNFALLAGIDPDELDQWYLGVYIDAIEWVELPNTRGMSQYADGGMVASKPYSASGSYINRMSDHCAGCRYDVRRRVGDTACPFNSLYWHFMVRNRHSLADNPRIGMLFGNWDRMEESQRQAVLETAEALLENLDRI